MFFIKKLITGLFLALSLTLNYAYSCDICSLRMRRLKDRHATLLNAHLKKVTLKYRAGCENCRMDHYVATKSYEASLWGGRSRLNSHRGARYTGNYKD